jgi:nucleoside-triphosphatase THEP1
MKNIITVMVYLISGKKNEGKTSKLKQLFEKQEGAFGFVAEKVYDCGRVTTYNLVDIKTEEKRTVARLASLPLPEDWGVGLKHGPFTFSSSGFGWARGLLKTASEADAKSFFIDELGKMELNGNGHADLIKSALISGMDLYIAVRDTNVDDAVQAFGLTGHTVIKVG